jgi:hypothetical protein
MIATTGPPRKTSLSAYVEWNQQWSLVAMILAARLIPRQNRLEHAPVVHLGQCNFKLGGLAD